MDPASNVISLHYGYNFSNRGQITAYMPRYSACSYFGMFQMKVPNNTTWSSTDAQNLIYGIVDAMNTNFNYPTLTTGDTVGVTVLDNNRFKIFDTATNIPFDFQNSGTAHITFGSIVMDWTTNLLTENWMVRSPSTIPQQLLAIDCNYLLHQVLEN